MYFMKTFFCIAFGILLYFQWYPVFHMSLIVFTCYFIFFGFLQQDFVYAVYEVWMFNSVFAEVYSEPCQTSKMEHFAKIVAFFCKMLHHSCLKGFWIWFWLCSFTSDAQSGRGSASDLQILNGNSFTLWCFCILLNKLLW